MKRVTKYDINDSFNTFNDSLDFTHEAEIPEESARVEQSGLILNGRMGWVGVDPNRVKVLIL